MNKTPRYPTPATIHSLAGNLLVAAPQLPDMAMHHGVVLLLGHSTDGAQGVLMNSPINEAVRNWCREVKIAADHAEVMAQIQKFASSAVPDAELQEIPVTVCMAETPEAIQKKDMIDLANGVRVLLGRIDWKPGELEQQVNSGAWMMVPATKDLVFGHHENLWNACVRRVGELTVASFPGVTELPDDILAN